MVLAIEVDGYAFHNKETKQANRDVLKNHIFETYNIPYIRFSTTGSNEKVILIDKLNALMEASKKEGKPENDDQTERYMYYCDGCNKLFKAAGSGKKIKCTKCHGILRDINITETEYNALDNEAKKKLKKGSK